MKEYVQFWVTQEIDNMNIIILANIFKNLIDILWWAFNISWQTEYKPSKLHIWWPKHKTVKQPRTSVLIIYEKP
jgi:hypothetical protein